MKLNLGCGTDIKPGWTNVDIVPLPGVDLVGDISDPKLYAGIPESSVTHIQMFHILEHIANPLPMLEALYRIAAPNAILEIRVPHGANDMAFSDPQHIRQYFPSSFQFFAQPAYKRADYGYRGDWETDAIQMLVDPAAPLDELPEEAVIQLTMQARNFVWELRAKLHAVKPIRPTFTPWDYNPKTFCVNHK